MDLGVDELVAASKALRHALFSLQNVQEKWLRRLKMGFSLLIEAENGLKTAF